MPGTTNQTPKWVVPAVLLGGGLGLMLIVLVAVVLLNGPSGRPAAGGTDTRRENGNISHDERAVKDAQRDELAALFEQTKAVGSPSEDAAATLVRVQEKALELSSPDVRALATAASKDGPQDVAPKLTAITPRNAAERVTVTTVQAQLIGQAADAAKERPEVAAAIHGELARTAPDEVKPIYQAAANRSATPAQKFAAVKTALQKLQKLPGDYELDRMTGEMKQIAGKLKTADGAQRKELLKQLDAKSKAFDKRTKEVAASGGWDKIAGPVAAAGEVMVEVSELSEKWDDASDAEKVAGVCGVLGSACLCAAPFLPPPANAIVAAVGAALKILEFIIPKLFGGGKGGGGQSDKNDAKSTAKGGAGGKPDGSKPNDPKSTAKGGPGGKSAGPKEATRQAVGASVAGGTHISPAELDPGRMAKDLADRVGLKPGEQKQVESAYKQTVEDLRARSGGKSLDRKQVIDDLAATAEEAVPDLEARMTDRAAKVGKEAKGVAKLFDQEAIASAATKPEDIKKARERVVTQMLAQAGLPTDKAAGFKNHVLGLVVDTAGKDSASAALQVAFAFHYYGVDIPAAVVGGVDD